jgi:predicted ABC-type transport system involved in lysophospholipase L1 biosynthesis ATPase subunit
LLDALVRAEGGTMIVATHSATVAAYCDRTLDLREGRLVANDAPGGDRANVNRP